MQFKGGYNPQYKPGISLVSFKGSHGYKESEECRGRYT